MDNLIENIDRMINECLVLSRPDEQYAEMSSSLLSAKAKAKLASIENILSKIFSVNNNPYSQMINGEMVKIKTRSFKAHECMQACVEILKSLKIDIEQGLIGTLENQITAKTFDDFLSHAELYLGEGHKMQAGVISAVVFEDTIKRICTKFKIKKVSKLDACISALSTDGHISKAKAANCRAAAAVRNSATHADWEGFDLSDVEKTIATTRELMEQFLE